MIALKQALAASRSAKLVHDDQQQELVAIPVNDWATISTALRTTLAVAPDAVVLPRVLTEDMMQAGWPADTAQEGYTAMIAARPPVSAIEIPPALAEVARLVATQDNRITSHPIFIVQQKAATVANEEYNSDRIDWVQDYGDSIAADEEQAEKLEAEYQVSFDMPEGWRRVPMRDEWRFVTACFTEKGCEDYLKVNGHNLHEPRIYVESGHRNAEWQLFRSFLLALAASQGVTRG